MDTTRCPLYRFPKKRRRSVPEEIEVVSRKMVNFFAAAWRLERKNAKQNDGYEKQMVSMNLDMRNLKEDVDKVNEVKIKALDGKLQMMEDKLTQSLDCLMKVAMTLRVDQEKLATNQVQLQTDQETISTNVVQVVDKIKTRFKDLENENAKLKASQDSFSGMGSKRLNCPVHQKEGSKKQKKKPGGG